MSRRPTESGWGSDEDDLLTVNDGGISAFRMQDDDEIDEAALLGLDESGFDNSIPQDQAGGDEQADYGEEQQDLLEIQVNPEEEEVLDYEDDIVYSHDAEEGVQDDGTDYNTTGGEMDPSQAETQDLSQTDTQEYYEEEKQQEEMQDYSQEGQQEDTSYAEENEQERRESDSESNSDDEGHGRLRFKSERPNIITLAKAKPRSDIPDTLEVSAEQQAQISKFEPKRHDRGRGGQRGRLGDRDRGGHGFYGDHRGRPMRGRPHGGPRQHLPPHFHPDHMGPPCMFQPPMMRSQPQPLMGPPHERSHGPQFGNRMPVGPISPRPLMAPLLPGQVPFGSPAPLQPRLQHLQQEQLQLQHHQQLQQRQHLQQQQQEQLRPVLSMPVSAAPRPHKILINPNFRGPVPSGPPVSASTSWVSTPHSLQPLHHEQPQLLVAQAPMSAGNVQHPPGPGLHPQPLMSEGGPPFVYADDPRHSGIQVIASQSRPGQPFAQPQGPRMVGGPHLQPGTLRGLPQQSLQMQQGHLSVSQPPPQSGYGGPPQQGMPPHMQVGRDVITSPTNSQSSLLGPVPDQVMSPPGFPGQHLPGSHDQHQQPPFSPPFNNNQPSRNIQQHPLSPRVATSPRMFRGPASHQRQQQQQHQQQPPQLFAVRGQRRLPQKQQAVLMARKLTQQAKFTQQAKAAAQNKNITVVPITPLKRRSTDTASIPSPAKVARPAETTEEEPMDDELKQALEKQKQLREMIRKRKEANRRKQAAVRRQELEKKLAEKGLTIEDIEGGAEKEDSGDASSAGPPTETSAPQQTAPPAPMKKAQPIRTLVTGGQQQQQQRQPPPQQQQQPHYQQAQQQQSFQNRPRPSASQQGQPHLQPQRPNTGQSFQPRFPNQSGGVRPLRQQQFRTQAQQFGQQQQVRQPRPSFQRQQQPHQHLQPQHQQQPQPLMPQHPQRYQQPQQQHQIRSPQQTPQQRQERFQQLQQEYQQLQQPHHQQQQFQQQPYQQQPYQQQLQNHFQQGQPYQQQHIVDESGDAFSPERRIQQNTVAADRGLLGRIGVKAVRGRGVAAPGRPASTPVSPQRQVVQPAQGETMRTVIPSRGGMRGSAVGPPGSRVVMAQGQRQVMSGGLAKVQKVVAGPGTPQQVSIDNLSASTTEQEIRSRCLAFGPVKNVIMIPSQKKAIVTFTSQVHALAFAKQWNRRMVNLSMISVSMLP